MIGKSNIFFESFKRIVFVVNVIMVGGYVQIGHAQERVLYLEI